MFKNEDIELFLESIVHGEPDEELKDLFRGLDPLGKAQIFESIPISQRVALWPLLGKAEVWEVIACLQNTTANSIVSQLDDEARQVIQEEADSNRIANYASALPKDLLDSIILEMDQDSALSDALSYDEEQVGRYQLRNFLRVREGISVDSVLRRLKKKDSITAIFLVNDTRELIGYIPTSTLFNTNDETLVEEIARPIYGVTSDQNILDIAKVFHFEEDIPYIPVLSDKKVVGAISVALVLNMAQPKLVQTNIDKAVEDEDLFSPLLKAVRPRGLWLCINLVTAFLASWVIGWFEGTLQQVVALAILMPVVASMGGIAGSQTLAVTVRGLALGHVHNMNIKLLFNKEMKVAIFNGILIGALIALVVSWWFHSIELGLIIWVAIVFNSLAAAASGTYIPFLLQKMNIDPAVASAVILTTITDVMGFLIFLGLGTILLLN